MFRCFFYYIYSRLIYTKYKQVYQCYLCSIYIEVIFRMYV